MTVPEQQRDVWVSAMVRHVPAHRVPAHGLPVVGEHPVYHIACPPFLVTGGHVITRRRAGTELEAFPCLRCFPPPVPAPRRTVPAALPRW